MKTTSSKKDPEQTVQLGRDSSEGQTRTQQQKKETSFHQPENLPLVSKCVGEDKEAGSVLLGVHPPPLTPSPLPSCPPLSWALEEQQNRR